MASGGGSGGSGGRDTEAASISGLVPMIRVRDIERSTEFYRLLGFEVGNRVPPEGPPEWVWLYTPKAADWRRGPNLMLTLGRSGMDSKAHVVLFYLYAKDLVALRNDLLGRGVAASQIDHPDYLPEGEFGVVDPDGYQLMIAQSTSETP